jgi:Fe-S oxidoreductase
MINEIIKEDYRQLPLAEPIFGDLNSDKQRHRIIASLQVSPEEYTKITTATSVDRARYVFFPGCNVYYQPEKILTAIDIMGFITDDYAFVPGLDSCCGDVHLFLGQLERADEASEELVARVSAYKPETVVLWCPTCHCRFETTYASVYPLPFHIMSFPQFIAEHVDKLPFTHSLNHSVTLHEACKSAYTGTDLTGPREVLRAIPGLQLRDMPRHGKNTVCCGSGAFSFFPSLGRAVRDDRLREAADCGADALVNVCHYCHETFVGPNANCLLPSVNYVTLVAQSLGIAREDTFKKYKQWGNVDRILADAADYIEQSPYTYDQIVRAVRQVFTSEVPESPHAPPDSESRAAL